MRNRTERRAHSMCQWTGAAGAAGACVAGNTYLSGATAKAWMAPGSLTLGVGQPTTYSYDYRLRLTTIQTGITATSQNLTLTYDDASNVTSVADGIAGETVSYGYDALNRLKTGTGFAGALIASYSYDAIGNLTSKQEGTTTLTLPPLPSGLNMPHPHAVRQMQSAGVPTRWFTYDADGNQVGSGNDALKFDAENRLVSVRGAKPAATGSACGDYDDDGLISILDLSMMSDHFLQTRSSPGYDLRMDLDWDASITILDLSQQAGCPMGPANMQHTDYLYDGNGTLLKRTNINTSTVPSTSTWTIYIGGIFEKSFSSTTAATGTTDYYAAYGRAIAVRQTPATGTMTLSYLLADQLGSTVGTIDAATGAVSAQKYWPFGGSRSSAIAQTDKAYTRQQREQTTTTQTPLQDATDALGTYFYHARFYSTVTGRFVSADPIAAPSPSGQTANHYSYTLNNPLTLIDPSGGVPEAPSCETLRCLRTDAERNAVRFLAHMMVLGWGVVSEAGAAALFRGCNWLDLRSS